MVAAHTLALVAARPAAALPRRRSYLNKAKKWERFHPASAAAFARLLAPFAPPPG
eukprot:SAG11_NODE_12399_length_705_cov_1.702970_1_plen_54_part_10